MPTVNDLLDRLKITVVTCSREEAAAWLLAADGDTMVEPHAGTAR